MARRVAGSIISAFAGWSAGLLVTVCWFGWTHRHRPEFGADPHAWVFLPFYALISAVVVFTIWAVALLPLYLLVPPQSLLWRWPTFTLCGAFSGAALMYAWHQMIEPQAHGSPLFVILAALIGAVTCFTGSRTRLRFDG